MIIEYYLLNPCGNITALVTSKVKQSDYKAISALIMKKEPTCEQVGFFSLEDGHCVLSMAGGEFCGNATAAAAALNLIISNSVKPTIFKLKVSGEDKIIKASAEKSGEIYVCSVFMPKPVLCSTLTLKIDESEESAKFVRFNGISHIILDKKPKKIYEDLIKSWATNLNAEALGIMFYDKTENSVVPLVYVKKPETLFWENSCLSGTTAIGYAFFSTIPPEKTVKIKQPAGELLISNSKAGLSVENTVSILKKATIQFFKGDK